MKRQTITFGLLGLTTSFILATGCSNDAPRAGEANRETRVERAYVRFINATDSGAMLHFGDDMPFGTTPAGTVTEYKSVPAERRTFKLFTSAKTDNPLATNSEGLGAGKHYTMLAVRKEDGSYALNAMNDAKDNPVAEKAKMRVINAAPGVGDIDVLPANWHANDKSGRVTKRTGAKDTAGKVDWNDSWFDGIDFNSASDYREINPALKNLVVRTDKDEKQLAQVAGGPMQAGKLYSLVVMPGRGKGQVEARIYADPLNHD